MGEVKLIATTQSFPCARIEWGLKLKGVEYEYIKEDLLNKSELLLKSNPVYKKVPVLVHGGNAIVESLVILEYIDETWKDDKYPLLPRDPYKRAMSRFWAKFIDDKCVVGAWSAMHAEGEEKRKAVESAIESFAFLEKEIEGKKFFGGKEVGFLDIAAGWIPHWLKAMEEVGGYKLLEPERLPSLYEWSQNFIQIPIIKETIPPREDIIEYFNAGLRYRHSLMAANKQ